MSIKTGVIWQGYWEAPSGYTSCGYECLPVREKCSAGPAAILGTTLAEYFGGTKGVGVLMINSLAQVNAPRAYALGAVVTIMCAALYFSVGLLSRLFPWVGEV